MLLVSEFLEYVFKFIVLGVVAFCGVLCGSKIKKNKLAKEQPSVEGDHEKE